MVSIGKNSKQCSKNKYAYRTNYGKIYNFIIGLFLNALLIVDLVRMIFSDTSILTTSTQYTIYLGIVAFVIYDWFFKKGGLLKSSLFIFLIISIVFFVTSVLVTNEIAYFGSYFIRFFITRIFPAMYLIQNVRSFDFIELNIKKYGVLWIIYTVVGLIWIPLNTVSYAQYSMTFSYNLLLPVCFLFYELVKKFNIITFVGFIFILGSILWRGSRGAFLCIIIFMAISFITINKNNNKNTKVFRSILLIVTIGIIFLGFNFILSVLAKLFPASRTINLLSTNLTFDSGRSDIVNIFLSGCEESGYSFHGIFSDRIYYSYKNGVSYNVTNYPHNFFIEILYQYGLVLTIIITLYLFYILTKSFIISLKSNNLSLKFLYYYLFCSGIVKLFFSASYLISVEFFMFISLCLFIISNRNMVLSK